MWTLFAVVCTLRLADGSVARVPGVEWHEREHALLGIYVQFHTKYGGGQYINDNMCLYQTVGDDGLPVPLELN